MQHVPALGLETVAAEFGEAGHAPDFAGDAEILGQQIGPRLDLAQDRARAEQARLERGVVALGLDRTELVHPLENALLRAFGHRRMRVILVQRGDVEIDVLVVDIHALQAGADDDGDFVGIGRVVADAIRDRRGEHVAMAVLVLQPLAVQGRAPGGSPDQEAARAHVARRPGEIADALEPEHRIIDVERDHRRVRRRIGGARGDERGHRAGLVDALLQDLALRILAVIHQLIGVLRPIELALLAENADLAEQALHAEGAALVGHDRHDARPDRLVAQQRRQDAHERHRRGNFAPFGGRVQQRVERGQRRNFERRAGAAARRQRAAERRAALPADTSSPRCLSAASGTGLSRSPRPRSEREGDRGKISARDRRSSSAGGRSSGLRPPRPCRSPSRSWRG